MKRYHYFIYYRTNAAHANVEAIRSEPITEIKHIREMEREIEEFHNRKDVVIINWKLLRVEEVEETEN